MFNLQKENSTYYIKNSKEFVVQRISKDNRKSFTARVKPEDLIVFNQRLKLFSFNSINELVHEFIAGIFPQITEDKQIEKLIGNTHSNGPRTVLKAGNTFNFYKNVDLNDMYNYYHKY